MTKQKYNLSLQPYKGTRDFYPEDMFIQNYIFSIMKKIPQKYGYNEYNASILEETNLYKAKSGEEIVNEQTYSFIDRGGRDVTIRPEMTPTVARMIAQKRNELIFPARWFSIPNLFRYERPQRGRLREHWQLNVDVFGMNLRADLEIISIAYDIMHEFGAKDNAFKIKINSRKLINYLYKSLNLNDEQSYKLSKLIDKKNKITPPEFEENAKEIIKKDCSLLFKFLETKNIDNLPFDNNADGINEIKKIIEKLKKRNITNAEFDPTLMRGFDYYTNIIFEVYDTNPENPRALFGGGEYDDLVSIFGVEKITACGFGMGDVGIRNFLEVHNLLPKYTSPAKLYVCVMDTNLYDFTDEITSLLRKNNINVYINYDTDKKIDKHIKNAEKLGIKYFICIGENEAKTQEFKLKNLETHQETHVNVNNIKEIIN